MKNQLKETITDLGFIRKLIPQKDPFVMVDRLYYFDDTRATSGLFISEENLLSTETHFSEAGLIENMAQSVALFGGYGAFLNEGGKPQKGLLGAIKILEIFELPKIRTYIRTEIEVEYDIMGVKLSRIIIKNEQGKVLATSTMKTATLAD